METAVSAGNNGSEIIKSIKTEKIKVPLSVSNTRDRKACGLSEVKNIFSRAILNVLLERKTLMSSGKDIREIIDTVYKTPGQISSI
jgi:hypothetical protein